MVAIIKAGLTAASESRGQKGNKISLIRGQLPGTKVTRKDKGNTTSTTNPLQTFKMFLSESEAAFVTNIGAHQNSGEDTCMFPRSVYSCFSYRVHRKVAENMRVRSERP